MKFSRYINLLIAVAMLFALLPVQTAAQAKAPAQQGEITRDMQYLPGQMVVSFEMGKSSKTYKSKANALAGSVGAMVADRYQNVALLEFDPQADLEALADQIMVSGQAMAAQPNYIYWMPEDESTIIGDAIVTDGYQISSETGSSLDLTWEETSDLYRIVKKNGKYRTYSTFPKELLSGRLWAWDEIEADLIWTNSARGVPVVAVLDTGVDYKHKDLSGRVINGYDFFNDDKQSYDDNGHGTHVAGIIAARTNYNYKTQESGVGVSNSKVLSVKVLSAQGYGTSYSLAAGIIYAAKNRSVKVINLSLGSSVPGTIEYYALQYAINTQNKLVVAAAGNDSSSDPVYPAAWALATTPPPASIGGTTNSISHGLISVAAARAPRADDVKIWVDKDGSGTIYNDSANAELNEIFSAEECATGIATDSSAVGSNYGDWVSIVAPGESIYSTTPTSYPFYLNYYGEVAPEFDYLSGSSMAAAFVSGAAARVLGKGILDSLEILSPNSNTKLRLINQGQPLDFAVEENPVGGFDPSLGYDNPTGIVADSEPVKYGEAFSTSYLASGTGTPPDDVILAPYCWPEAAGTSFETEQDMTGTVYLNVADAMNRGALWTEVKDAATAQPINKALVAAYDVSTVVGRAYRRAYAKTTAEGSQVVMINLPIYDGATTFDLKVSKGGYTSGYQTFNTVEIKGGTNDGGADDNNGRVDGTIVMDNYSSVSIAPNANIQVVLDWQNGLTANYDAEVNPALDMYLWVPQQDSEDDRGIVGPIASGEFNDGGMFSSWADDFLGLGTILSPTQFTTTGIFDGFPPYAQHMYDGGLVLGQDGEGNNMAPTELITIKRGGNIKTLPYAFPKYTGDYVVMVTDYDGTPEGYQFLTKDVDDIDPFDFFVAPIVRVWANGKLVTSVKIEDSSNCTGSDTYTWWKVTTLNGSNVPVDNNTCVETNTVPYGP